VLRSIFIAFPFFSAVACGDEKKTSLGGIPAAFGKWSSRPFSASPSSEKNS
jgi:hypothetical protein